MPFKPFKYAKYTLLAAVVGLSACKSTVPDFVLVPQDPKVVLRFELMNNGEAVHMGEEFVDEKGVHVELLTLSFFTSHMKLVKDDGSKVELSDVECYFMRTDEQEAFNDHYDYIIPSGNYTGIEWALGLDANQNNHDPSTFPNDDPLGTGTQMYWDWATLYRFVVLEYRVDLDNDGTFDGVNAFHTGLDTMYFGAKTYPMTWSIEDFAKDTLTVEVDWNKLFYVPGPTYIDQNEMPYTHTTTDSLAFDQSWRFTLNFLDAITVRNE